jgi:mono/diheme cytochrome c family protein
MIKKILKWTGIILLVLIAGISITVASRQHLTYSTPYPDVIASTDSAIIARGKELIFGPAHCTDCHAPEAKPEDLAAGVEVPLTGGYEFDLPIGKVYSRNITPDDETGIGKLSPQLIARALRYGIRRDSTAMLDFMAFHNTSDEDLTAIISYIKSRKPIHKEIPKNEYNLLGNAVLAFLIKPVGPTGEVYKSVKRDSTAEYGKYLANSVANCNGCHTKRDMMTGGYIGEPFAGGTGFQNPNDPEKITYFTPNLTPDPSTGRIYNWSQQNFIDRFRKGRLIKYSDMPWGPFSKMSDDDLKAIYKYLKTLPAIKHEFPVSKVVEE